MFILILTLLVVGVHMVAGQVSTGRIQRKGMTVSWHHAGDRVYFEVSAPTTGWVTIGFNESAGITGAYLLMGRVSGAKAEVVEHRTLSPGNYRPITELDGQVSVRDVSGGEENGSTTLNFSLPTQAIGEHQKSLPAGRKLHLILAYSQADDFRHHSRMRTSMNIEL